MVLPSRENDVGYRGWSPRVRASLRPEPSEGATAPTWAPNGRELFYVRGDQFIGLTLDAQGDPVGREQVLFPAPTFEDLQFDSENPAYDVMPDGQHFVLLLSPRLGLPKHYDVVLNWFEELKEESRAE